MLTLPNLLSLLRIPLIAVFLQENPIIRALGIVLAIFTDGLDGYFARRYKQTTTFGKIFDPLTDKFFVIIALTVFYFEGKINAPALVAMLCRDFAVIIFGLYLIIKGQLLSYQYGSIWCGKATTFLQFFVLIALTFSYNIPQSYYFIFVILGGLALAELYITKREGNSHFSQVL